MYSTIFTAQKVMVPSGGLRKRGVKIHPFHFPWIRACAALLEATDSWAFDIDRGNVNAIVLLDLKKAFDTVTTRYYSLN